MFGLKVPSRSGPVTRAEWRPPTQPGRKNRHDAAATGLSTPVTASLGQWQTSGLTGWEPIPRAVVTLNRD